MLGLHTALLGEDDQEGVLEEATRERDRVGCVGVHQAPIGRRAEVLGERDWARGCSWQDPGLGHKEASRAGRVVPSVEGRGHGQRQAGSLQAGAGAV